MDQWIDIPDEEDNWVDVGGSFTRGLATTFGYNDPQDNGVGAWGTRTNNPNLIGVSLPIRTLREHFGDENKAKDAQVEVFNPATGQKILAPIVDKGPANWVIARQGPTIDLTEGARRALGSGSKTPMQWRFAQKEDQWLDMPAQDIGHGQEVPKAVAAAEDQWTDLPKAEAAAPVPTGPTYLPDDQIKDRVVKMRITNPDSGEVSERETGAIEAQSFIKGHIDTYTILMNCLQNS